MRRFAGALVAGVAALAAASPAAALELRPDVSGEHRLLTTAERSAFGAPATPFNDPAGDQVGMPVGQIGDITLTDVTDSAAGLVTFDVEITNVPTVRPNDYFQLVIDADLNPMTGDPAGLGSELLVILDGATLTYFIGRFNGTSYAAVPNTAQVNWVSGPVIVVSRHELGLTATGFNFFEDVLYFTDPAPADPTGIDSAPDGTSWNYVFSSPLPPLDTSPPNTTIVAGMSGRTARRTATFRFRSSEAGSTFRCRLDLRAWTSCRSPRTYRNLRPGRHTFRVRARDAAGNVDPTPARRTWTVRRPTT